MKKAFIEITFPSRFISPGEVLSRVLRDTGVHVDPLDTKSRVLGTWCWEFNVPEYNWNYFKWEVFGELQALFLEGRISYGSVGEAKLLKNKA